MKKTYIKKNIFIPLFIGALSLGSCVNDLDISPIDPQSTASFDQNGVFAKEYATLVLTGQKGATGNADFGTDKEDESGLFRLIFNSNELATDECAWAWQENTDIPQFTFMSWNSSSTRVEWTYNRLGYNITQYNFFLDQIEGKTDAESLHQRAEVRFLRALNYWYFLDLFNKAPFKEHFNNDLPVEIEGQKLYDYIQKELGEIENDMYEPRKAPFGRADKAANWMLRAELYLNAEVYTGKADWSNALIYANKVIDSSYKLCPDYKLLFMADNDENELAKQEIILPIRQDGANCRSTCGADYIVSATRKAGMPRIGTTNGWSCIFARQALINKFFPDLTKVAMIPEGTENPKSEDIDSDAKVDAFDAQYNARTVDMIKAAGDDRALFYGGIGGGIRTLSTEQIKGFNDGLSVVKWQNIRSDGKPTHDSEHADVDLILFRLSEAYLIRAEVLFRTGGDAAPDINVLRKRANCTRLVQTVTEKDIIDEWCREFYLEGRRRIDLKRFDMYTTSKYLWDWKGGVQNGTSVSSIYNYFPIPDSDINNNKNMHQNKGY